MRYWQKVYAATNLDVFVFYLLHIDRKRWLGSYNPLRQAKPNRERERVDGFHEPRTKQNENTEIYYDFDMQSSFHLVLNSLLWVWFSMKQKIRRPYEAFSERMEINTIGTVFVVNECIWICQLYNGNKIMWRCNDGIGKQ